MFITHGDPPMTSVGYLAALERRDRTQEALTALVDLADSQAAACGRASEARTVRAASLDRINEMRRQLLDANEEVDRLGGLPDFGSVPDTRAADNRRSGVAVEPPTLFRNESRTAVTDWARTHHADEFRNGDESIRFGAILRGMITGETDGCSEPERRALAEGTASAGGVLVPTPVASSIIDKARVQTSVLKAGARVTPMTAQTLKLPRLLTEPDPSSKWRSEGAVISTDNLTLDFVTLTAQSNAFEVLVSRELVEDATVGGGVDTVLRDIFAKVMAIELDRVALFGSGTAPQPRGVLNTSGITTTAHGANGATVATLGYDMLINGVGTVRGLGWEPTGQIASPRLGTSLSVLKDSTGQYIEAPTGALPPLYLTRQVPINVTTGTSTDTSYVFTGQWDQMIIGQRVALKIDVLKERHMIDAGQYGFLAWTRSDIAVLQPAAFAVDTGVRG
jgi:HK97 family phage major capsid protein